MTAATINATVFGAVSTVSRETPVGCYKLVYSRRNSKKVIVPAELAYRDAMIGEDQLRITSMAGVPSKFAVLLQSTVYDLAQEKFKQAMIASDYAAKEINPSHYGIDEVLAFWAEKKEAEKIDAKQISAWLLASDTFKQEQFAEGTGKYKVWTSQLPKIAAPAFRGCFDKDNAASILAQLLDSDVDTPIGGFIAQRLADILNTESKANAF